MFTSEEVDVVAAFELATGEELWRYTLGEKYAGHTGSDDGPIGTPTVSDGMVYALGPRGQLVALALEDGAEKWRRELDEENSTVPFYGYTTSPLVMGKQLIIATGGEGHAVTAFDRATGQPKWTKGDDTVSYQTPMLVELGGRKQLLTVTNQFLQGLDPVTGEVFWKLQHSEGEETEESAHPTPVDGNRFLVKYNRGSRLYRLTGDGVEEVWSSRAFANTYALPVLIDGHFYGFSGSVLTCADAETGEIVWRSRQLRGLGLSAVHPGRGPRSGQLRDTDLCGRALSGTQPRAAGRRADRHVAGAPGGRARRVGSSPRRLRRVGRGDRGTAGERAAGGGREPLRRARGDSDRRRRRARASGVAR
jgi:hypothetical protein